MPRRRSHPIAGWSRPRQRLRRAQGGQEPTLNRSLCDLINIGRDQTARPRVSRVGVSRLLLLRAFA